MQACYRQNKSIVSLKLKVHIQIVHFTLTRWRLRNNLDRLVQCISQSYLNLMHVLQPAWTKTRCAPLKLVGLFREAIGPAPGYWGTNLFINLSFLHTNVGFNVLDNWVFFIERSKFFQILIRRYSFIPFEQKAPSSWGAPQPTKQRPEGCPTLILEMISCLSRKPSISHQSGCWITGVWRNILRYSYDQNKIKCRLICSHWSYGGKSWEIELQWTVRRSWLHLSAVTLAAPIQLQHFSCLLSLPSAFLHFISQGMILNVFKVLNEIFVV